MPPFTPGAGSAPCFRGRCGAVTGRRWLERPIQWRETGDALVPYSAECDGRTLELRLGDFPAEDLYTLLVDGIEIASCSEWPSSWVRPSDPAGLE